MPRTTKCLNLRSLCPRIPARCPSWATPPLPSLTLGADLVSRMTSGRTWNCAEASRDKVGHIWPRWRVSSRINWSGLKNLERGRSLDRQGFTGLRPQSETCLVMGRDSSCVPVLPLWIELLPLRSLLCLEHNLLQAPYFKLYSSSCLISQE